MRYSFDTNIVSANDHERPDAFSGED